MQKREVGYYFIVAASVVIVLAGVKSASEIVVPFLLSLFLAIILSPMYNFFNRKGIPSALSMVLVISIFIIFIFFVVKLIGSSVEEFNANIGFYEQQLLIYFSSISSFALKVGIEIPQNELAAMLNPKQIFSFATGLFQAISSIFTNGFVILLTVVFMMLESEHFFQKIEYAGSNNDAVYQIEKILSQIKEYMVLKALISIFTGFVVWIALLIVGTDYAFLLAVLAFMLNFIPNIGSIIAAVPAILLTLIEFGLFNTIMVALTYTAINVIVGSIIEPKVMGKGLDLSTLIVFLSLIFWGWLLGIVGMLLSIPLTIMVKIILGSNKNTQWISTLLGSGKIITAEVSVK